MDMLRALGTFARIVETGSFSAVARESNTNSSTVTRVVGQLEEHFGVRLFHRTTRHLSLTEDGQELLGHARQIIDATAELEDTLRHQRSTPTGRVRLGLTAAAARLITSGLPGLLRRYPGLSVDLGRSSRPTSWLAGCIGYCRTIRPIGIRSTWSTPLAGTWRRAHGW